MTLIELVVIVSMFSCAFFGAQYARRIIGGRWAWLLGGIIGFVLSLIGMAAAALLSDLATGGMRRFPNCREGTCRGRDAYQFEKSGESYHFVCRHGGRYKRRGRKFVVVNADGTEAPYLAWIPFRGWFPDA